MNTKILRKGSKGPEVKSLQLFLIGLKIYEGKADGDFGPKTESSVKLYQRSRNLVQDGVAGPTTQAKMSADGKHDLQPVAEVSKAEPKSEIAFPKRPSFGAFTGNAQRMKVFGAFDWKHRPEPGNRENIVILGDWEEKNIVKVHIPQLEIIKKEHNLTIGSTRRFHIKVADAVAAMWADFELEGVLEDILTYDGDFFPRLIRGSSTALSNHAFGTAFDINAEWNGLSRTPAPFGKKGSVYRLIFIAHKHGFYWGGHFSRVDGMHFEASPLFK